MAIVKHGFGGTTVNSGGTLQIQGGLTFSNEALTLNGLGFNNGGALQNATGNNTWAGPITLGSSASVGAASGTLTLNKTINDGGNNYGLTLDGPGTVVFSGTSPNTYTGLTDVVGGTLQLNKSGGLAVAGNLTIGAGTGSPNSVLTQLEQSNQISPTATVTINSDGKFDLNGQTQTIATLNMVGGTVALTGAARQLTLAGNVSASADSAGNAATISGAGTLSLGNTAHTFTVAGPGVNAPAPDMVVSGMITGVSAPA